ncbi:MAG: hypothetical protein M3083_17530 [Actinomycetota bacterium]|nr:hypothetical protein [Actinomycetota bacterium]
MAQVVDMRSIRRGLRRRGRVVLAALLIGVVAAGGFVVLSPTTYVASARVVLPPSPVDALGHDARDINTEVQIVRSAAVLGPSAHAVRPTIELPVLQRAISVGRVSSQIIEVAARSDSAARAAELANAVAASYVAYADDTATADANATAAAYSREVGQISQQIQQLNQQVASGIAALAGLGPAETQRREAALDTLRTEQATLSQQLNVDQARIADALLQAQLSRQGTQVLQPAVHPTHPSSPKPAIDLAIGAVAGLLIGGLVALALENGDHRLRTRHGISAAIGAPVLASLVVNPFDRPDRCQEFLEHWEPSVVESYSVHQAFARLAVGDGPMANLVVVGLEADTAAGVVALEMAICSTMSGTETAFVFASRDDGGAGLRAACASALSGRVAPRPGLAILGATGAVDADRLDDAGLVITFVVADSGPIVLPTWDRKTKVALVVSAGHATADRLEAAAAACLDAGGALSGALVANPDPSDRSTGQGPAAAGTPLTDGDHRPASTSTSTSTSASAPAPASAPASASAPMPGRGASAGNGGAISNKAAAQSQTAGSDVEGRVGGV